MAAPPQPLVLAFVCFAVLLLILLLASAAALHCLHRGPCAVLGFQEPKPVPPPDVPTEEGGKEKRRKRKGRRMQQQQQQKEDPDGGGEAAEAPRRPRFPLASVAGALQRRIMARYDELARASQAHVLTIDQVSEFINCLVDARDELLHKSEIIQRSFKIKKALLFKADRSSFDRLCQQVLKLEAEHQRLEKDAAVYNLLQEQLTQSPAYKTMLEISAKMEKEAQEAELASEVPDISFEELLAQEKRDSFWQRNGKMRSISTK